MHSYFIPDENYKLHDIHGIQYPPLEQRSIVLQLVFLNTITDKVVDNITTYFSLNLFHIHEHVP